MRFPLHGGDRRLKSDILSDQGETRGGIVTARVRTNAGIELGFTASRQPPLEFDPRGEGKIAY